MSGIRRDLCTLQENSSEKIMPGQQNSIGEEDTIKINVKNKSLNFPYFKVKYLNKFQDRYMFQISEDGAQKTVYCPFMRKLSEALFCLQVRKNICMNFKIK